MNPYTPHAYDFLLIGTFVCLVAGLVMFAIGFRVWWESWGDAEPPRTPQALDAECFHGYHSERAEP